MYQAGTVCLIDFGMAGNISAVKDYLVCGTENYLPPEMLKFKGYEGAKVDVWCLGVLFYCLLVGEYPFGEKNDSSLKKKILGS